MFAKNLTSKRTRRTKKKGILAFSGGLAAAFVALLLTLYPAGQAQAATTTINVCSHNGTWFYNILGSEAESLRDKLDNPANFGPAGTYGDFDFVYIDVGDNFTEQTILNNSCNIWLSGYEPDYTYTATELTELQNWVTNNNGQVIAGCDGSLNDPVCSLLDFSVTDDTDTYGFVVQQLVNPITCDGALDPSDQLEMAGGAGAYFTGSAVTSTNVLAVHETGGVADSNKPIIVYTGNFFLTADVNMFEQLGLSIGPGINNNNDIMTVNAFSALADVSVGNPICSSAGQTGDIEIIKVIDGATPGADWAFNGSPTIGDFTLPAAGGSDTFSDLAADDYTVSETTVGGWVVAASCSPGNETGSDEVTVSLAAGDAVSCTFTNTTCQPGAYDNGLNVCQDTDPGHFVDQPGATEQTECSPGYYQDEEGQEACKVAPAGTYAPDYGMDAPLDCEEGYTSQQGATACYLEWGTITVVKEAGDVGEQFEFDPSWSDDNFFLYSGGSETSDPLPEGTYSVNEVNLPSGWSLEDASCVNEGGPLTPVNPVDPSSIPVEDYDAWVCTFTNVYTPPSSNICPAEGASNLYTDIIGQGMGSVKKHKTQLKLNVPNWMNVDSMYGQMVAKDFGKANYVRFYLPGKNNYVQVNTITSPIDHTGGNFWYGAYLDPAQYVKGRWFLQKSGTKGHIPRAFLLYPTYADPNNTYVNVWDTYDASEGEVYWDTAGGWTAVREITVPIAPPNGSTTFHVELAVADNDKDNRRVWVTVTAGGVTQSVSPNNPDSGDLLNLLTFDLPGVPAGTDEIVIEIASYQGDGAFGDSASLVGMAAHYECGPLN